MLVMYPGRVNSPVTRLASAIDATITTITVLDSSVFPAAPNLLVIGSGADAETCLYTSIVGNVLTVQRGFQGVAKAWEIDMYVARNFTEYDYRAMRLNIEELVTNEYQIVGQVGVTEHIVTHNLNTKKIVCALYDENDAVVHTSIDRATMDTVKVTFGRPQVGKTYTLVIN